MKKHFTKKIKKWGDSLVITLNSEDRDIHDFKEGDVVEVEIEKEKLTGGEDDKTK